MKRLIALAMALVCFTGGASAQDAQHFLVRENESDQLSLIDFEVQSGVMPRPSQPYDRDHHYGRWFDDPNDQECQNTRAKILIRDSQVRVTFTNPQRCTVRGGEWFDDYTGDVFRKASDIQIDHMVPLKNSYISGGFAWPSQKRCLYANYLGFSEHLIPVSGIENQKKSDHTPAEYMPPAKSFRCRYLHNWLFIKLVWRLRLSAEEKFAIDREVENSHCDQSEFLISREDLAEQRQILRENAHYCDVRGDGKIIMQHPFQAVPLDP